MKITSNYNDITNEYNALDQNDGKLVLANSLLRYIPQSLQGKKCIDFACGSGYLTRKLAKLNPAVIAGLDLSEKMIEEANNAENENPLGIAYSAGNVLDFSSPQKYDIATAMFLLNYAKNTDELTTMLESVYASLETGGLFVGITPNPSYPNTDADKTWNAVNEVKGKIQDGAPMETSFFNGDEKLFTVNTVYFTKKSYENAFKDAGFKNFSWNPMLRYSESAIVFEGTKTM